MARKIISDLPVVSHKDVEPMYSKDEILDKLASAVNYLRNDSSYNEQRLELELLYSLAKAFYDIKTLLK